MSTRGPCALCGRHRLLVAQVCGRCAEGKAVEHGRIDPLYVGTDHTSGHLGAPATGDWSRYKCAAPAPMGSMRVANSKRQRRLRLARRHLLGLLTARTEES